MADWHFAEQRRDDVDDETTVSKNFARESRMLVGVFVREFFQNVLDARIEGAGEKPVTPHVRIAFRDPGTGLPANALPKYLNSLYDHLKDAGHNPVLWQDDRANVLILEEFGTSGLIGDTSNSRVKGTDERWANFWFGEGKRTKRGSSLGRAGQGKITYHLISGAQTVFALTRQEDSTTDLLFGKCIVQRTHEVGGKPYKRHGYWPRTGADDQPLPSDGPSEIDAFKSTFDLMRDGETGTSWIIPYVDKETFSKERLIGEILRDFFFSIMADALTLDVMGTPINQSNLAEVIAAYPFKDLPVEFVDFIQEAITLPDDDPAVIRVTEQWYGSGAESPMVEDTMAADDLERAREALNSQGLVAVRLPVPIVREGADKIVSEISVFLKSPDHLAKTEEIYVRSGLVIGEEQHLRNAPGQYFGLMQAAEFEISEFLGFAEEASHMKWNTREPEVKNRYQNVVETIARVRHSLPKLAKLLLGHTSGRLDDALIEFLSIPAPSNSGRKAKTTRKKGKSGFEPGDGPQTRSQPRFRVTQSGTKWTLEPGPGAKDFDYPVQVRIDLAYATMPGEGNPFKVYHRFEFDLADGSAHAVSLRNANVVSRDLNQLLVELTDDDFELAIDGFSEHALKCRIVGTPT